MILGEKILSLAVRTPGTIEAVSDSESWSSAFPLGADLPPYPDALLEAGALAYRYDEDGKLLILLISKRRSRQWGIPKGRTNPALTLAETAAKEAFEEAGVVGKTSQEAVAVFRTTKRDPRRNHHRRIVEVWVYLLEVTDCLSTWPEKGKRVLRWVPCDRAAVEIGEPVLAELCEYLSQHCVERL